MYYTVLFQVPWVSQLHVSSFGEPKSLSKSYVQFVFGHMFILSCRLKVCDIKERLENHWVLSVFCA